MCKNNAFLYKNKLLSVNFTVTHISSSGQTWSKIYTLDSTYLGCFADFHWNMSGNSINIYNLCYDAVVLKVD